VVWSFGVGERAPWGNFPRILRNGDLGALQLESEYLAAKGGDDAAAFALAERLVTPELLAQVQALIGESKPLLVPVLAIEDAGRNKIPLAFAHVVGDRLGLAVDDGIVQREKVSRTGSGADHRLAFSPTFSGPVQSGQSYIVLDDTLTMGGTIASLRGYIENRGGSVIGAAVMTAHPGALDIAVKPGMLAGIAAKHGQGMNDFWTENFGYGIEHLTQGEAGHLKAAPSVDALRNRIVEARNAVLKPMDEGAIEAQEAGSEQRGKSGLEPEAFLESAREVEQEQQATIEAAPVSQLYESTLETYIEEKQEQAEGLADRLEDVIERQRGRLQQIQAAKPGLFALPSSRSTWQGQCAQQQSRLQMLEARLELVREIKEGMGLHSPRIEELATRKLRQERPDLASAWDAHKEAERRERAQERAAKKAEGQSIGRGQNLGLSVSRNQ